MSLWLWTGAQQRKKQKTTIAIKYKSLGLRCKVESFLFKFILLNVLNRLILIQGIQSTCLINRYVQNISWKDLLTMSSIGSSYYLLLKRNWFKIQLTSEINERFSLRLIRSHETNWKGRKLLCSSVHFFRIGVWEGGSK